MSSEDTNLDQVPDTGVPEDVRVELPFPMLVATVQGRHAIVAQIIKNKFFVLSIIDVTITEGPNSGRPLAPVRVAVAKPKLALVNGGVVKES